MNITGIDHVVLRVRDLDIATAFYTRVLGCTPERRQDAIGLVQLRAGESLIDLVAIDGTLGRIGGAGPSAEGRNMDHLCLRVADFNEQAVRDHLSLHGVEIGETGLRYGATGHATSIYLKDPDGNRLELRA